ncbi:MAG TPA: transglycosylase SLT domain-containing protein [Microvirga sp.]|jgi:hypothetical protein
MTDRMTASHDACDRDDAIHWLQPQSALNHSITNSRSTEKFRQLTASLGLGALLTFGSAGAAIGPASASPVDTQDIRLPQVDVPAVEPLVIEGTAPAFVEITLPEPVPPLDLAAAEIEAPVVEAPAPSIADIVLPGIDLVAEAPILIPVPVEEPAEYAAASAEDFEETDVDSDFFETASAPMAYVKTTDPRPAADPNELLQFDDMRVPRWIVETILRASEVTGVDPVYMMALADKESSFIPSNKASTSSAEGLFQFISSTWLEAVRSFGERHGLEAEAQAIQGPQGQLSIADDTMREHVLGLRRDPYLSALMAAEMTKRDRSKIERRLGRRINRSEFYLAHFFGVDSASKFMSLLDDKPKQSGARVFPAAARANKALFFAKAGRKTRQLSVAEVYDKIDDMIDKRLDRYENVTALRLAANL